MIGRVLVENYRGIRKLEIGNLRQVNIITGPNNSGKSSFLEAIYPSIHIRRSRGQNIPDINREQKEKK